MNRRILVTGASGTGTTTLGRELASAWSVPHADIDDYFWVPSSPPFVSKRPLAERVALIHAMFVPRDSWVASGSLRNWGNSVLKRVNAVVFLQLERDVRMARLMNREVVRYGQAAIGRGGALHAAHRNFIRWASRYDDPSCAGRTLIEDEAWLHNLACPILRLGTNRPVSALTECVIDWFVCAENTRE
jgi:adenylate kinase family enzyme